jgi:hypothetical protein
MLATFLVVIGLLQKRYAGALAVLPHGFRPNPDLDLADVRLSERVHANRDWPIPPPTDSGNLPAKNSLWK